MIKKLFRKRKKPVECKDKFGNTLKSKYNIDDTVWIMYSNKPKSFKVSSVCFYDAITKIKVVYKIYHEEFWTGNEKTTSVTEDELFSSKDELLQSLL